MAVINDRAERRAKSPKLNGVLMPPQINLQLVDANPKYVPLLRPAL